MSDTDDLAQRYLTLWTQYLTALLADPRTLDMVKRWHSVARQFSYFGSEEAPSNDPPTSVWPPFLVPFGLPSAAAGGSVLPAEDITEIAALQQRIDELEARLALLERQRIPRRPRRGGRAATPAKSP